ncbi:MAG TPA: tetratricopeptide repeat protein [Pyrinomonadaceae bacterium]
MKLLTILCMLGALLLSLPHSVNSSIAPELIQQERPLTLKQIEGLIQNRTPDNAIALEIGRRSVAFQIDEETVKRLRALGAGSRTLQALESQKNPIKQSRCNNESPSEKVVVLVANFESLDNEAYTVTRLLREQLTASTAVYPDIKIEPLYETITGLQGRDVARAKGKERNASIVLWGWITKTRTNVVINAHFEVLRESQTFSFPSGKQTYNTPLSELDQLSLQTRLSNDLTSVTLAATALARLGAQDNTGAISRFTEALNQRNGSNEILDVTDIYAWRGVAYFFEAVTHGADMIDRAIGDFDKVIAADEKRTGAYVLRAVCYIVKDEYDKAISDSKKILELESDPQLHVNAYLLLNGLYKLKKEPKQASAYLDKAKQIINDLPPDTFSYFLRAQVAFLAGDWNEALSNYDKALNLCPDTRSLIDIYLSKGNIYQEQERLDEALNELNKILQLDTKHVFAYILRGDVLRRKRDYESAIRSYSTAIQLNPRFAEAYGDRGYAYYFKGNHEQALKDYAKALELKPDLAIVYYNRGNLYRDKEQFDKALQDYEVYIKYEPEDGDGYYGRAAAYTLMKNYDAAVSDYEKIIQLEPKNSLPLFLRGSIYESKGNLDKALSDYDEAIKMKPDFASVYLRRAFIHTQMKNYDAAISDYEKIIKLEPKNPTPIFYRAINYTYKGNLDKALSDYEEVIKMKPDYVVDVYLNRAFILISKGNRQQAISDLQKVLQLSKDAQKRQLAEQQLQQLGVK